MATSTANLFRLRISLFNNTLTTSSRTIPRLPPITPTHACVRSCRLQSTSRPLPKLAQASIWQSMIPKFIRNRQPKDPKQSSPKSKEWNPASFYIIIFILIGSQAIRMIALKNDYSAYTRSTDAKIRLLREVIERVKNGEQVDVEKLLGTGDEAKEREWDEVLREIEREDSLWHQKQTESSESNPTQEQEQEQTSKQSNTKSSTKEDSSAAMNDEDATKNAPKRRVGFF